MERWHIFFSGRVQNVGFRYTCRQVADRHRVGGWVKNLPNGNVEMVVEGDTKHLTRYVTDISDSTQGHVADTQIAKLAATGEFSQLEIRR
jgi:acylphosphatase